MTKTVFYNLTLFDGTNETNENNAWFVVDNSNGKITARGTDRKPAADVEVDLKKQYVMPGFFNVHTHITIHPDTFDGGDNKTEAETAVYAVQSMRELLKSGVTFIRECGADYDVDIALKRMIDNGQLKHVPELLPSGKAYSMTSGHGDTPHGGYTVDSPDEVRKKVREGLKKGAKVIKLMATGGVMTPNDFMDDPQLSVAEMRAGVEEAHHKGLKAAAHAEGNPGIQNALDAGIDSIEHGFYVTEKQVAQMVKQGTYITPTLIAELVIPKYGKDVLPAWEVKKAADALEDTYHNFRIAYKAGAKFTCGTDAGTPFNGFDKTPLEFELLTKLGMTPAQAYQCSSLNSADLCGVASERGTLEVGKYADFQVLKNDPLADVRAVQQEDKQVYLNGQREF